MFYDKAGQPRYWSKNQRYLDWNPQSGSLPTTPAWLVSTGTSPIFTYGSLADRGAFRFQTKSATPASNDRAGLSTPSIDPTKYSEVGLFLSGLLCDTNTVTDITIGLQWSNASTEGFYYQNDGSNSDTLFRVYPGAAAVARWKLVGNSQGTRSKDLGFLMRNNGDIFITQGDPYKGGGVIAYAAGVWPTTSQPVQFYCITKTAAQRYGEVTGVTLLLGSN